jgi:hypothetical protein
MSYKSIKPKSTPCLADDQNDAYFIVFKDKAVKPSVEQPAVKVKELATIGGEANSKLQPSGLLGPVQIMSITRK